MAAIRNDVPRVMLTLARKVRNDVPRVIAPDTGNRYIIADSDEPGMFVLVRCYKKAVPRRVSLPGAMTSVSRDFAPLNDLADELFAAVVARAALLGNPHELPF